MDAWADLVPARVDAQAKALYGRGVCAMTELMEHVWALKGTSKREASIEPLSNRGLAKITFVCFPLFKS